MGRLRRAPPCDDWLALLDAGSAPRPARGATRTLLLAVLRGALLDLLATGDVERVDAAVRDYLAPAVEMGTTGLSIFGD